MKTYYKMSNSAGQELGRWVGVASENMHRMGEEINGETVAEIIDDTFEPDLAASVRQQRDELLRGSDWTQISDVPTNKAAWLAYRRALRDITNQEGFPNDVIWPKKPV